MRRIAFFLILPACFYVSFGSVGAALSALCGQFFRNIWPRVTADLLARLGAGPLLTSLCLEGMIAGVGGVLSFLPQLFLIFFCLALLKSSGYLERAACYAQRPLRRVGLSGQCLVPLVLGFGCTVPALLCCRELAGREKRMTMAAAPLFSCSARMPVFALVSAAFFPRHSWWVILSLYALGVTFALTLTKISSRLSPASPPPAISAPPPWRKPNWGQAWEEALTKVWEYILQAGSVILPASILLWLLNNFTPQGQWCGAGPDSALHALGGFLAPALTPFGCGQWQIGVALVCGLISKEAVVASLSVLLGGGNVDAALYSLISPLSAYALLVMVLFYTPCVASLNVMRRVSGSWSFTLIQGVKQLLLGWLGATLVFQLGSLLKLLP